ncbi:MAG: class I SAM-dependent methyltransferase [Aestuariivirga sp.]
MSMEEFWDAVGRQLRNPRGMAGRLIGNVMGLINRVPNAAAIRALAIREDDHVLEIGFGPGCALKALAKLAPRGKVTGVDVSPVMVRQASARNRRALAEGRMELVLAPYEKLPLADHTVDRILAVNVAYFFDADGIVLSELRRVLRPGGKLVLYVTDRISMARWKFAGAKTHRTFDAAELRKFLQGGTFAESSVTVSQIQLPLGVAGLLAEIT